MEIVPNKQLNIYFMIKTNSSSEITDPSVNDGYYQNFGSNDPITFRPYFVVFRYVSPDGKRPLFFEFFETLYSLYEFVIVNKNGWSFYSVGRCLEIYTNPDF